MNYLGRLKKGHRRVSTSSSRFPYLTVFFASRKGVRTEMDPQVLSHQEVRRSYVTSHAFTISRILGIFEIDIIYFMICMLWKIAIKITPKIKENIKVRWVGLVIDYLVTKEPLYMNKFHEFQLLPLYECGASSLNLSLHFAFLSKPLDFFVSIYKILM